ncbi:MAG: hypothetical protein OSA51_00360 [Octadecabacter sp.]|nr:hypothetical protein [Octadecabacter sp.]
MLGEMFRVENADMPVKKMGVSDTEYLLTLTPPKIERRLFWCEVFLITPKIIGGADILLEARIAWLFCKKMWSNYFHYDDVVLKVKFLFWIKLWLSFDLSYTDKAFG